MTEKAAATGGTAGMVVPFLNPAAQFAGLRAEMLEAATRVLEGGRYILGPEVAAFEQEAAAFCGARHGVGVNSGSDALIVALKALGVGPGDEVITSPFTYIAPAEAIHSLGARVVFADIDPKHFLLDAGAAAERMNARVKAIIPVHLFGQSADLQSLAGLGPALIEDAAQAIGATYGGRPVGGLGAVGCLSFYPTKNLGACGDGGMALTNDDRLARELRRLRVHGMERRYCHEVHGVNSRLDELQAALLRIKLRRLAAWNARRVEIAALYDRRLAGLPLETPAAAEGNGHIYHVYALLADRRDELQAWLLERGVPTLIYYPSPLHLQPCFVDQGWKAGDFPVAESVSRRILPLPIYPELEDAQVEYVSGVIRDFYYQRG